ncbi:hypothetical protein [Kribbella sp. C-35]|uniref:hypothetical protein n=1 Tax=Kribbella sp. C-35 TaxID=2789276 RepID=UPI00397D5681
MSDVVNDAAQVLVPLLAAGANAAVEEASKAAGKQFAGAAGKILGRIQKYLHRPDPGHPDVVAALEAGVDDGVIRLDELRELVQLSRGRVGPTNVTVYGKANVVNDANFNAPVIFE